MRLDVILKAPFNPRGYFSRGIEDPLCVDTSHGGDFTGGGTDEDFACRGEVLRRQVLLANLETRLGHDLKQNLTRNAGQTAGR